MSTRSTIAVVHPDGSVSQVDCHFDGYVDGVGAMLHNHYNDYDSAAALIAKGSIISLESTLLQSEFYAQERDEYDLEIYHYESYEDYYYNLQREEYNYVFVEGEWFWLTEQFISISSVLTKG